jgi:hypothetical protein
VRQSSNRILGVVRRVAPRISPTSASSIFRIRRDALSAHPDARLHDELGRDAEAEPVAHFLGRTTDDPRAQAIVKAEAVDTCYAIQDAIPAQELKR